MARHCIETTTKTRYLLKTSLAVVSAVFVLNACTNEANTEAPRPAYVEKINGTLKQSTSRMDKSGQIETVKVKGNNGPTILNSADAPAVIDIPIARPSINTKNLFGTSLRSPEDRLDRLERVVQDLRNEFSSVKPSVKRLISIEGELQRIIKELKAVNSPAPVRSTNNVTSRQRVQNSKSMTRPQIVNSNADSFQPMPVISSKRTAAPKKPAPQKSLASKAPSGVSGVFDVRLGQHSGRTRLVLDTGSKQSFSTDIDNGENIMIVELPNAGWNTSMNKNFGSKGFIKSYNVENMGEGKMIVFQLNKNAKVSSKLNIPAVSGSGHRIVIDLVSP